jgi:hypothetical protein
MTMPDRDFEALARGLEPLLQRACRADALVTELDALKGDAGVEVLGMLRVLRELSPQARWLLDVAGLNKATAAEERQSVLAEIDLFIERCTQALALARAELMKSEQKKLRHGAGEVS